MEYINLTGQAIKLTNGTVIQPTKIAFSPSFDDRGVCKWEDYVVSMGIPEWGEIPDDTLVITTMTVASALSQPGVVCPDMLSDRCERNDKGWATAYPGFVQFE